jgi:hypothetical protein
VRVKDKPTARFDDRFVQHALERVDVVDLRDVWAKEERQVHDLSPASF